MCDITVIRRGKGNYKTVIELHRNINLAPYGKFKVSNKHDFIWISDIMLSKLEKDFYVCDEV